MYSAVVQQFVGMLSVVAGLVVRRCELEGSLQTSGWLVVSGKSLGWGGLRWLRGLLVILVVAWLVLGDSAPAP